MSNPWFHAVAFMVVLMAMTPCTSAAEPAGQSHPCATVIDPDQRLLCYDAAFPPVADAKSNAEAQRQKALRDFGLRKTQMRSDEPERARDVTPDLIQAAVAGISSRAAGERVIRLDNGQSWLLTEVTLKGHLRNGDRVTIRRAALGSFMLVTPSRISLRARRIN